MCNKPTRGRAVAPQTCSVYKCPKSASFRVLLENHANGVDTIVADLSCPTICLAHAVENEATAMDRRGIRYYDFTKLPHEGGWERCGLSVYIDINTGERVQIRAA